MEFAFYLVAGLMLLSAGLVAFRPKPIESALWLILHFFLTSTLYVFIGADFVAVVQLLVYAGAIVVLITFVILLLNLNPQEISGGESIRWTSTVLFLCSLGAVLFCLHISTPSLLEKMPAPGSSFGSIEAFSRTMIQNYSWSFEVAGFLLLLALIGVGLLAYRRPSTRDHSNIENKSEAA